MDAVTPFKVLTGAVDDVALDLANAPSLQRLAGDLVAGSTPSGGSGLADSLREAVVRQSENPVMFWGQAGVGKTALVEEMAKQFQGKIHRIDASTLTGVDELMGAARGYDYRPVPVRGSSISIDDVAPLNAEQLTSIRAAMDDLEMQFRGIFKDRTTRLTQRVEEALPTDQSAKLAQLGRKLTMDSFLTPELRARFDAFRGIEMLGAREPSDATRAARLLTQDASAAT